MKLYISTKIWGAFCLTLWCTLAYAQNLLTNGSFETITTCPTGFNATAPTTFAGTGWSAPTAGTSDMICRDAPATSFSVTITPMPTAQAGTRYAGMQYGSAGGGYAEYLTTQLSSALVAGKTYTIEFYVWANVCASGCGSTRSELPTAYKNFGVRFSTAAPSLGAGSFAFIPPTFGLGGASISSSSTAYNAKSWVKETLTYTAVGGETYATFGTFVATPLPTWTAATNAYLFIDNASVVQACNAGSTAPTLSATTLSNTCPTTTVNLNSLVTSATPSGTRLRWHTVATNPMATDSVAAPSVLATAGTYYAYYFDATNNCYSPATAAVTVTVNGCQQCTCGIINNNGTLNMSCRGNNCIYPYPDLGTPTSLAGRDNNYSVFVGGNFNIKDGAEMEGKVFVAGDFILEKNGLYNVGWVGVGSFVVPDANEDYLTVGGNIRVLNHTATNTYPHIEVGGTIYGGSAVNGNVRVKGSVFGGTPSGPAPVVAYAPSQIINDPTLDLADYNACFTTINQNSQCWKNQPQSANASYQYDSGNAQYVFSSTNGASGLYVFNLTDDLDNGVSWAAAKFMNFPDDATILININLPGNNDNISFLLADVMGLSPKLRQRIIWNLPDAQTVSFVGYAQFWGSLVTPSRTSTTTMGMPGFNGRVIVGGNLIQQSGNYEFHNYSFQGDLSSITCMAASCVAGTTAPTLSGTTLSNTCPTTTVNLNSLHTGTIPNGARLRWHTVATNPTTLDSVATPSVLATAGTYYAYYFDATNNCYSPATAAVTVTINSNPNAPTTTVSQPTCAVSTGVITVTIPTSGVTYSFDNGTTYQASATSNALASGTYQVVVKNSVSNCVSTPTATTVNPQPATPTISLVAKGDPSVSSCPMLNNGTISVTATGANLLFSKDNGATWQANNVFSALTAGSYSIKVKDNVSNCEAVYATNPVVLMAPSCGTGCNVPKPSITNH